MTKSFFKETWAIATPVALQSMLQNSFSFVDQIMVGTLGATSIAAVEVGTKPGFVFNFVALSIASVCTIMVSQYVGKNDEEAIDRSLSVSLLISMLFAFVMCIAVFFFGRPISSLFTKDQAVITTSTLYLKVIAVLYLLDSLSNIFSVPLFCQNHASIPLYISLVTAVMNTFFNYVLIFGQFGAPRLGVAGAALSSVIAGLVNATLIIFASYHYCGRLHFCLDLDHEGWKQYWIMLIPVALGELLWSIGQNVYTSIYGHMGTQELAAMSLTGPLQGMMIGALSGLSKAAGILIGQRLGKKDMDAAYHDGFRLCLYGLVGSVLLSLILAVIRNPYISLYHVNAQVKLFASEALVVFAILAPVKVVNMILSGGVLKSGGLTRVIFVYDTIGTYGIGIPAGLICAYVFHLSLVPVYFFLSLEEVFRLIVGMIFFKSKKWMVTIH